MGRLQMWLQTRDFRPAWMLGNALSDMRFYLYRALGGE